MKHLSFTIAVGTLLSLLWVLGNDVTFDHYFNTSFGSVAQIATAISPAEPKVVNYALLFVGDVLLARDVETYLNTYGSEYPYRFMLNTFSAHDAVVANFEAAIPLVHSQTPDLSFQFSVDSQHVPALTAAGVTHVSLANNHAFDYGLADFAHTQSALSSAGITPFGKPKSTSAENFTSIETNLGSVALLAFDETLASADRVAVVELIRSASEVTTIQIAYVHWGEEYEATHSFAQEELAELLIDEGVDLVLGHHPHVVQDIQVYKEKLIVYSLGNFIFDQYFSTEVQQGLMVSLELSDTTSSLTLIPVSSLESRVSPAIMNENDRYNFLADIGNRSSVDDVLNIEDGQILLGKNLAVSPHLD